MNQKMSIFMMDDSAQSERHNPSEDVMDYVMKWTLHNSVESIKTKKPILQKYCKNLICAFMGLNPNNTIISDVKIWRQFETENKASRIDLWIEVALSVNGEQQKHAICVEDKIYTGQHGDQLKRYKEYVDNHYAGKVNENWHVHYILATCHESGEKGMIKYEPAKQVGFTVFSWDKMVAYFGDESDTESEIFNEFWLRRWY